MRLLDARAGKIASNSVSEDGAIFREPLSVHASPRSKVSRGGSSRDSFPVVRERGSTQDIREVDHSFSFNYDRKGYPFSDSRSYCGEFARKVNGSSRENPPVESPIAKNLYQTWACKEVQSIATGNALYNFLEEQAREAREETVAVEAKRKIAEFTAATRLRNLNSEKGRIEGFEKQILELSESLKKSDSFGRAEQSRFRSSRDDALRTARSERSRFKDDIPLYKARIDRLRKHIFDKRVSDEPLFMQYQAAGSRKLLKKLITNGLAVLGETMCELKVDKKKWGKVVDDLAITDLLDDDLVAFTEVEDEAAMTTAEGEARIGGT
ncbi:hypothetical protein AXX17_AT3G36580 [Arabidopsis thaliana]|uniref:DUF1204 domain-containing protein n=1 Tax=Arabidopsis thaliana TaxID=3702 RepID=A0A178VE36_ARATH|nr:hypothetical protein AXX17_AT3G36580 [Arabidopsis thaliana]